MASCRRCYGYVLTVELVLWGIWLLTIVRSQIVASVITLWAERDSERFHFFLDWSFLAGSLLVLIAGRSPSSFVPRLVLVAVVVVVVTALRLHPPGWFRMSDRAMDRSRAILWNATVIYGAHIAMGAVWASVLGRYDQPWSNLFTQFTGQFLYEGVLVIVPSVSVVVTATLAARQLVPGTRNSVRWFVGLPTFAAYVGFYLWRWSVGSFDSLIVPATDTEVILGIVLSGIAVGVIVGELMAIRGVSAYRTAHDYLSE